MRSSLCLCVGVSQVGGNNLQETVICLSTAKLVLLGTHADTHTHTQTNKNILYVKFALLSFSSVWVDIWCMKQHYTNNGKNTAKRQCLVSRISLQLLQVFKQCLITLLDHRDIILSTRLGLRLKGKALVVCGWLFNCNHSSHCIAGWEELISFVKEHLWKSANHSSNCSMTD